MNFRAWTEYSLFSAPRFEEKNSLFIRVHPCPSVVKPLFSAWIRLSGPRRSSVAAAKFRIVEGAGKSLTACRSPVSALDDVHAAGATAIPSPLRGERVKGEGPSLVPFTLVQA